MLAPVSFTSRIRQFNHWRQQCSVVKTCQEYDRSGLQIAGMWVVVTSAKSRS